MFKCLRIPSPVLDKCLFPCLFDISHHGPWLSCSGPPAMSAFVQGTGFLHLLHSPLAVTLSRQTVD